MHPTKWIYICVLVTFLAGGANSSFLQNYEINIESRYRKISKFSTPEQKNFIHFPQFRECNQREDDLLLKLYRKRRYKRFILWSRLLRENEFFGKFIFAFETTDNTKVLLTRDWTFIPMNFGPIVFMFLCVLLMGFNAVWCYYAGMISYYVAKFIWEHVSVQPIRRYIRAKVIARELLERRKNAYLRKVIPPNVRKPPKAKFRLYWMWRDFTFEEIPDVLAEQENDPLYPKIRGPESSTESDGNFDDYGDESYMTKEELEALEIRRKENERLRLLAIEREKMVTGIAMKELPSYRRLAVGLSLPYSEEKQIMEWRKKAIEDAKAQRKKKLLFKIKQGGLGKAELARSSILDLLELKRSVPLTDLQTAEQDILSINVDKIMEETADKWPIPLSLNKADHKKEMENEKARRAEKRKRLKALAARRAEYEKLVYERQLQEAEDKKYSPWLNKEVRGVLAAKRGPPPDPLHNDYFNYDAKKVLARIKEREDAKKAKEDLILEFENAPPPPPPPVFKPKLGPPRKFDPEKPGPALLTKKDKPEKPPSHHLLYDPYTNRYI